MREVTFPSVFGPFIISQESFKLQRMPKYNDGLDGIILRDIGIPSVANLGPVYHWGGSPSAETQPGCQPSKDEMHLNSSCIRLG